jgi:hypothetical protein
VGRAIGLTFVCYLSGGLAFDDPPTKRWVKKQKKPPPPSHFYRQFVFEKDKLNLKMNLF